MQHTWAVWHVKSLDDERRTISGIASTPSLDRQDQILDPAGVTFAASLPLLLYHDSKRPVGRAQLQAAAPDGIAFTATLPLLTEPGPLKDRVDEAWQSIKAGLITGVSIGFRVLSGGVERLKSGAIKLTKTEICELSLVTIPANVDATILSIKALDAPYLAALGRRSDLPRVKDAHTMKQTTAEQIQTLETSRAAHVARMASLMDTSAADGKTLDDVQRSEYDDLQEKAETIDGDLSRLRALEKMLIGQASPVVSPVRTPAVSPVQVKSNLPLGTAFTRVCIAIARGHGVNHDSLEIAKTFKDTPEVELYLKTAVAAGSTSDPAWAGALATVANVTAEFIGLLRPATIIGKIPNLRQVPFNVSVPVQTAGGSYGWVGQGSPKPVTKLGFSSATISVTKAAGIIILTEELVRTSSPSAEAIVRADMIAGIAQFLDGQFIDPTVAAVANVNPGSITNGTTAIASGGDPLEDLQALVAALTGANVPLAGVALIMSETNGFALGLMRDSAGNRVFSGVGASGGTMEGINVITSGVAGTNVILFQPNWVLLADEGGVNVDVSREASVAMDTAPTGATALTSLWQNNLVGLRAERFINWQRGRLEAVKYVSGADYSAAVSPAALSRRRQAGERGAAGK